MNKLLKFFIPLLKFLNHIRFNKYPPFISYKLRGAAFTKTRTVLNVVKPGDIILRRFSDYVTSKAVPGYYSHVGIVIDSETVIHAIAKGVIEEDIIEFCRTDKLAILRFRGLASDELKEISEIASSYLGRPYDYSFSLDSDESLFCTELVANATKNIIRIEPTMQKFLWVIDTKLSIRPDSFLQVPELDIVFKG